MKRFILLLSIISLTVSCNKEVQPKPTGIMSIAGTWILSEAKFSQMPNWLPVGDTVVITNSWVYGHWDKPCQRISNTQLVINSVDTINLTVTGTTMFWEQNLDSIRFIRL